METLAIPVALFGFNRPDKLRVTIESLRPLAPAEVWFFIDGPRADRPQEPALCSEVASLVSLLDWGCQVVVRRNQTNKGLRAQIRDGLTEFFRHHEAGLIVEDDVCIAPDAAAYINHVPSCIDGRTVAAASLNNFLIPERTPLTKAIREQAKPYLSVLFHCWGWVTTRSGWALYRDDIEHACDEAFFRDVQQQFSGFPHVVTQWEPIVSMLHRGLQSWACRYQLSLWKVGARCIVPPFNLASNIGFDGAATHTVSAPPWLPDWKLEQGTIDLTTPPRENIDCDIDELSITSGVRAQITCRLCGQPALRVFTGSILGSPHNYYECSGCGSLETSVPSWLAHAYSDNISSFDTGVLLRNMNNFVLSKNVAEALAADGRLKILEYGAGSGLLTRLLRDSGLDGLAYDIHNRPSLAGAFAVGSPDEFSAAAEDRPSLILAFEVFEHFTDPAAATAAIFGMAASAVLVTTDLYQGQDAHWTYLTPFSGQHVFFYSYAALELLATTHGYDLISDGNTHLFLSRTKLDPAQRGNLRLWQDALRRSIYSEGGLNRFVTHLGGLPGVMRDYNELVTKAYAPPSFLQPRIYLNRPDSGRLYIDCIFFQMGSTGIAKLWNEVFRVWSTRFADRVVLLDRGGEIEAHGLRCEAMPRFAFHDAQSSIRALTWHLMRGGARSLLSTYYTFCEHLPTRAVVYDMIPETLGFTGAEWDLKRAYLQHAQSAHCISRSTLNALTQHFPHLRSAAYYRLTGISPVFQPLADAQKAEVRRALAVERPLLFVLPCVLGGYKDGLTALQAAALLPFADDVEIISTVPVPDAEQVQKMFPKLRIRFMRFAADADFAKLLAAADLVLWPSRLEGIGYPPMEAVASGTRMVCVRNDVNQEVYGDAATYAESGDPVSFASAMTHALAAPLDPRLSEIVAATRDYETYAVELFNFGYYGHPAGEDALGQALAA